MGSRLKSRKQSLRRESATRHSDLLPRQENHDEDPEVTVSATTEGPEAETVRQAVLASGRKVRIEQCRWVGSQYSRGSRTYASGASGTRPTGVPSSPDSGDFDDHANRFQAEQVAINCKSCHRSDTPAALAAGNARHVQLHPGTSLKLACATRLGSETSQPPNGELVQCCWLTCNRS